MKLIISVLCMVLLCSSAANAALEQINWAGNYTGITVVYNGLSESSDTDSLDINNDGILDNTAGSLDGLYGRPRLDGDALAFDDLDFFSTSTGDASDTTDGKLAGQVASKPNFYVDNIRFTEYGDVTLSGFPSPTRDAFASIANNIFIKIQEVDGVDIPDIVFTAAMAVNPSNGDWYTSTDGMGTKAWTGTLDVDITAKLREAGYATGFATLVDFTLDNTLSTAAMGGGTAYIAKKESGGLIIETYTPEPATLILLGLGSLLFRKQHA